MLCAIVGKENEVLMNSTMSENTNQLNAQTAVDRERFESKIQNYWNEYTDEQKAKLLLSDLMNMVTSMISDAKAEMLEALDSQTAMLEDKIRDVQRDVDHIYDDQGWTEF